MKIGEVLIGAASRLSQISSSHRLDAELLLGHVLGFNKTKLISSLNQEVDEKQISWFDSLIERRLSNEPIAYIIGMREFYGREFIVSPDVLIPRPETEELIQESLRFLTKNSSPKILDLGTGSGCLAVTLAAEIPSSQITAVDISKSALDIAKQNAGRLIQNSKIIFLQGSWFEPLKNSGIKFDLIVSNPPYILRGERISPELKYEPDGALYSEGDGLSDVRRILEDAKEYLADNGALVIEVGSEKKELLNSVVVEFSHYDLKIKGDLSRDDGWRFLSTVNI